MRIADDEAGITLIEIMVSLVLLGIVLTAFFRVMTGSLQSLSESRIRQEVSQIATQLLENARDLDRKQGEIAMLDGFAVVDGSVSCSIDGAPGVEVVGDSTCEALVISDRGVVSGRGSDWGGTSPSGAVVYDTYVTATGEAGSDDPLRVTVVAQYDRERGLQVIRRSTLISEAGRG